MSLPANWDWKKPDYDAIWLERTERLKRLRAEPSLLAPLKQFYSTNPIAFCNDMLATFDPRLIERDIEAVVPFLLFPKQEEFIKWTLDRWKGRETGIVEKSRDGGFSWLCVAFGVWMWTFHPGVVVGYGSRKEIYVDDLGNPASLFWKVRQCIELMPIEFRPRGWDLKKHAPHMRIMNPENGAVIVGEAGENLGRGARTSIYFVDEAAFLERPEIVDAALSQTTNCRIDVSTPNGEGNPFARKRKSGKYPVFTGHWMDDPRKDNDWYEKQKRELDPVVVAQEIDISYSASVTNAYVPGAFVSAAMAKGPADVPRRGPVRMGVDVARFGNDSSVITIRDDRAVFVQDQRSKIDLMSLCGVIKDTVLSWPGKPIEQIAIDVIGIGAGVVDRLLEMDELKHVQIIGVNSSIMLDDGRNYNTRARIWRDMKDWLDPMNGPVSLPMSRDLEMDLTALHYGYRNSKLLIESKDDAKKRGIKSPDRADSLALTFAEPVRPRRAPEIETVLPYMAHDSEMGL